jgi:hypothetical protein
LLSIDCGNQCKNFIQIKILASNPGLVRKHDSLVPSLRSLPVGSYLSFYRPITQGIEVIRVLMEQEIFKAFLKIQNKMKKSGIDSLATSRQREEAAKN